MEVLLQLIKRVERKLDTVIRAIYEHDEGIGDEYGRSQRTIDAGRSLAAEREAGDVLGCADESSLRECAVPGVPDIPKEPITKRSPIGEAIPIRDNGAVQREEHVSRSHGTNQNVPRKDGNKQHATSKSRSAGRGYRGGGSKGGFNEGVRGSN